MKAEYSEWLELADLNLATLIRSRMRAIPKAILFEKNGLMVFSMGAYLDGHLNGILRYAQEDSLQNTLELYNRFLQLLGYGYVVWIREHADSALEEALRNLGLMPKREPGSAGMITEHRLAPPEIPPGLVVSKVSTNEEAADFTHVVGTAFGLAAAISQLAIGPLAELTKPNVEAFLVRDEDKPVAAGLVIIEQGVAGIYYISTIPEARGRGLGELCTRITTNAGFDLGARAVILQASVMGEPLYERLGYKTITRYRWYPITKKLGAV